MGKRVELWLPATRKRHIKYTYVQSLRAANARNSQAMSLSRSVHAPVALQVGVTYAVALRTTVPLAAQTLQ